MEEKTDASVLSVTATINEHFGKQCLTARCVSTPPPFRLTREWTREWAREWMELLVCKVNFHHEKKASEVGSVH